MKVLYLVIARGGSKSVPKKNLQPIGSIPLLAFKIISAQRSRYCSRLVLSSDDSEIQDCGRRYGAEVPFTRPSHLASDTASSESVVLHAMDYIEAEGKERYDAVMLLEPSTPFATGFDYDNAVDLMMRENAHLVVGMRPQNPNRIFIGEMQANGNIGSIVRQFSTLERLDRQSVPPNFTFNGAYYLMNWDFFRKTGKRYCDTEKSYGVVMDSYYSVEIDDPVDLEWARFLTEKSIVDLKHWL